MAYHRSSATGSCDSTNPVVTGRPFRKYCSEEADLLKKSKIRLVNYAMRDIPLVRFFYYPFLQLQLYRRHLHHDGHKQGVDETVGDYGRKHPNHHLLHH